jgi:hypothetical protein
MAPEMMSWGPVRAMRRGLLGGATCRSPISAAAARRWRPGGAGSGCQRGRAPPQFRPRSAFSDPWRGKMRGFLFFQGFDFQGHSLKDLSSRIRLSESDRVGRRPAGGWGRAGRRRRGAVPGGLPDPGRADSPTPPAPARSATSGTCRNRFGAAVGLDEPFGADLDRAGGGRPRSSGLSALGAANRRRRRDKKTGLSNFFCRYCPHFSADSQ